MSDILIECVPNFSEGRDNEIIKQITDEIEKVEGVKLLDVDPGPDMNRTVVTFIGNPKGVKEAAFNSIKKASELIDMRKHTGSHPRMGATDVCPFVPVSGITTEECIELSKEVAKRVGEELNIPVYLYEKSAQTPERENLAIIRQGEYEALETAGIQKDCNSRTQTNQANVVIPIPQKKSSEVTQPQSELVQQCIDACVKATSKTPEQCFTVCSE